jgi:hypothetical protein
MNFPWFNTQIRCRLRDIYPYLLVVVSFGSYAIVEKFRMLVKKYDSI